MTVIKLYLHGTQCSQRYYSNKYLVDPYRYPSISPLSVPVSNSIYVTGYWKTDHNVTLGQLHFIGPANSHTHALSMH